MLATWKKIAILTKFAKCLHEMFQLTGYITLPRKVPKCWQIWQKRQNFVKGVDGIFRLNTLFYTEGSQNVGEFGKNGKCGQNSVSSEISPRVDTKSLD